MLAGALLTIRVRPGGPGTSLLVVPVVVAYARFGLATMPALAYAQASAEIARGVPIRGCLISTAHTVVAFFMASTLAQALGLDSLLGLAVFAIAFTVVRWSLWHLAVVLKAAPLHARSAERPNLLLSLLMAPLAALPVLAGEGAGDGALLLALTGLIALLILVREATNLATARIEANIERDRLAHAKELQEEMLNLITHDVRNPLTAIMGYTQLSRQALQQETPEQLPRYLAHIESSAGALRRLMDNLLRLSRLEHEAELSPAAAVSVASLAQEVIESLRPLAEEKHQTLDVDVPQDVPRVLASPLLLSEALSNLVSNAIKYTPEGGRIRIWARNGDHANRVRLCVTDTGIGLSEADRERLFTRFFRSTDPRAGQERGSGLGLALTHSIVTRMGGRVLVESELNRGTTFCLELPRAVGQGVRMAVGSR
jgi:signal transduction histidine kinase